MNLNYLFNKKFYDILEQEEFTNSDEIPEAVKQAAVNKRNAHFEKCACELFNADFKRFDSKIGNKSVNLRTVYPGLLIGIGNPHGAFGGSETDLKLGFSFDYVTGLPYIPGSSVKGVLRSAFKKDGLVSALLSNGVNIEKLENDIFAGEISKTESKPINQRDIFYDAVIVQGDEYGKILSPESITYHESEVKNPNPVKLIKVRPNVTFQFNFDLKDSEINGVKISADDKLKLFTEILKLLGIGAKTNVGFGMLEEAKSPVQEKTLDEMEKKRFDFSYSPFNPDSKEQRNPGAPKPDKNKGTPYKKFNNNRR